MTHTGMNKTRPSLYLQEANGLVREAEKTSELNELKQRCWYSDTDMQRAMGTKEKKMMNAQR